MLVRVMETLSVHGNITLELSGAVQITRIMVVLYRSGGFGEMVGVLMSLLSPNSDGMVSSTRDLHDVVAENHRPLIRMSDRRVLVQNEHRWSIHHRHGM
jgi:hypothetical protein